MKDTFLIDIFPGFDVVYSVDNDVKGVPISIRKVVFGRGL
jgi:hypothetical protein